MSEKRSSRVKRKQFHAETYKQGFDDGYSLGYKVGVQQQSNTKGSDAHGMLAMQNRGDDTASR